MKSSPEVKRWCVFDFESEGWDRFTLGTAVTHSGDAERFETRAEAQRWLQAWDGPAAAHSGGTFDFLFLEDLDEVLLTGSRILSARCGRARLKDTFPMMPMSLKKIGKAVGLEKLEVDRQQLHQLTREEVFTYCERDSRVLAKVVAAHRDFCLAIPHRTPQWPWTAGATAVYCAEAFEPEAVRALGRHPLDFETWVDHAAAVQGGRCELWRLGEVAGPVYAYDVKSSYPARYLEAPLPVGPWRPVGHEVSGLPGVWRVRFRQPPKRLPLLSADGVFCHRGEGWATSEEVEAARSQLGAHVEVLHGWVSSRWLPFGQAFVKRLFRLKEEGSPFAKVCLNALHGKFGQRVLSSQWRRAVTPKGVRYVRDEEVSLPRWYQRPLVEAHILARARVALWRAMDALHRAGRAVLYTDTDSIHTDAPPEDFARLTGAPLGGGVGEWELKGEAIRALYLAPKVYALQWKEGDTFVAAKGLPAHRVSWEVLEKAWHLPQEIAEPWGLEAFRTRKGQAAQVRTFERTLRAHPGTGKRRTGDDGCRVWYTH